MNEEKSFKYGGYTFVPLGRFTSFGIKANTDMKEIMKYLYFINRGYVADGHEKYNYDDFYKAAGIDCDDDVFFCPQTKELYVPCEEYLAIFDKTAKDSKEVQLRFENRRVPCPIDEGANLNSDVMFENLFDDGIYVEHDKGRTYIALGFILGNPMIAQCYLHDNYIGIAYANVDRMADDDAEKLKKEIPNRLRDEQVEADIKCYDWDNGPMWRGLFYYTPAYVVENFYPKE